MIWIIGILFYFLLVWLFLRFFKFISDVDKEIEQIQLKKSEDDYEQE